MRVLEFIVEGQTVKRAPGCDFSGIVAGSSGYLFARFRFSPEWDGCKKVATFRAKGEDHHAPLARDLCLIPEEALTSSTVLVTVHGRRPGYSIDTNQTTIPQTVAK